MSNGKMKQKLKELYDSFFDSALAFRREQDRIISEKCNDLMERLDSEEITIAQAISEYEELNIELGENYRVKKEEDEKRAVEIENLENNLDKKDFKEIRKYSKKIAKATWKLKGINQELNTFVKRIKRST